MIFLGLCLLFAVPFLIAWYMYSNNYVVGAKMSNNGQLISPALHMQALALKNEQGAGFDQENLRGKWIMMYVNTGACRKLCRKNLYFMRQIKTAMGKDQNRVERVLLTFSRRPGVNTKRLVRKRYPGTVHVIADVNQYAHFVHQLQPKKVQVKAGELFIVDPKGNIMMRYSSQAKSRGEYKDLKRLLKASQIG
jgi:cytochrome oxidase Cu insertion factor (SCO1/SenC/PrrC family)